MTHLNPRKQIIGGVRSLLLFSDPLSSESGSSSASAGSDSHCSATFFQSDPPSLFSDTDSLNNKLNNKSRQSDERRCCCCCCCWSLSYLTHPDTRSDHVFGSGVSLWTYFEGISCRKQTPSKQLTNDVVLNLQNPSTILTSVPSPCITTLWPF